MPGDQSGARNPPGTRARHGLPGGQACAQRPVPPLSWGQATRAGGREDAIHASSRFLIPPSAVLAAVVLLAAPPCAAQKAHGPTYQVAGRVVDSIANPIPGADVSIPPLHITVRTDVWGRFKLAGVPAGNHLVQVRKIGYGPVNVGIRTPRDTSLTPVVLAAGAVQLRTVVTRTVGLFGKPARLAYTMKFDAFYERRKYSSAGGLFYTHEDVDRMDVQTFWDVLHRIPHLEIWDNSGNVQFRFPRCGMGGTLIEWNGLRIWPTGAQAMGGGGAHYATTLDVSSNSGPGPFDNVRDMPAAEIEGIEVYPSPSSLPVEAMGNACAAIFVWTD